MRIKLALLLVLMLIWGVIGCANTDEELSTDVELPISVRVNPAIELVSTIHYLAGTGQYDEMLLGEYLGRVDGYFSAFRDHSAVKTVQEMNRLNGINGSAPMALAVYLGEPPGLEPVVDLSGRPDELESRWTVELIDEFLVEARKFAAETQFMDFYNSQQDFHAMAIGNLEKTLKDENLLLWYDTFFGYRPEHYVMYIGLINGSCNYGFSVTHRDGEQEFISLLGARWPDKQGAPTYRADWFKRVIVHEYCHSYINPLVNNNPGEWKALGEELLVSHREKMIEHGYNAWNVLLFEYIVRACTVRYFGAIEGARRARNQIAYEEREGFPAIGGLVELFDGYENNRTHYPDIASFVPEIKQYFETYLSEIKDKY